MVGLVVGAADSGVGAELPVDGPDAGLVGESCRGRFGSGMGVVGSVCRLRPGAVGSAIDEQGSYHANLLEGSQKA